VTGNGLGVNRAKVIVFTLTAGPEPVRNLSFEVVSEGVVSITWIKPAWIGARAQILHYEITYGPFGGHNTTLISVKESVTLRNLDGKIPYSVVVKAQTNESLGERATIVVFSSEGVPTKPVGSVKAYWKSGSSVVVSWQPTSYAEATGIPLYMISYLPDNGGKTGSVNTTNSSTTFKGLDRQFGYVFAVQVTTGNGKNKGDTSYAFVKAGLSQSALSGCDSYAMITVGAALGGMAAGVLTVLLLIGIVCGVCKARGNRKPSSASAPGSEQKVDVIYDQVDAETTDQSKVAFTSNPAYECVQFK
jgi:hypothetical protein